jgi:hypothetical protein
VKTEDLVDFLSTNTEAVDRRATARMLSLALAAGIAVALVIALVALGVRPDLITPRALVFLVVKLAFAIGIVAFARIYLVRLARPGGEQKVSSFPIAVPFLVMVLLAAIGLWFEPTSHWDKMILGDQWLECLLSIPIIAIVPFAGAIWAMRQAAPTNLVRAGAFAGLAAGAMSAIGYALHCTDDSFPFVAVWYGGTIVLCTLAGAALGPRLLRW